MAIIDQLTTDRYTLINGDCCEVLADLPDESIHLSVYSPPFCGLYVYSSSERDLSNSRNKEDFLDHYRYVVDQLYRVTLKGRITAVHCADIPMDGSNLNGGLYDLPGDIIRLHESVGWKFAARHMIWKEPLAVRNRTLAKGLAHKTIVDDASLCDNAAADQLLLFRKKGENPIPVTYPNGLMEYIGERQIPADVLKYRGYKGKQTANKFSHWIWRQYASSFWDDVRIERTLPYKEARDAEDEKHVHPLQLDVIERIVTLRSNPNEVVLTPFLGVGSEVYGAVRLGRKGVGIELKPSYFKQAIRNLRDLDRELDSKQEDEAATVQPDLFSEVEA